MREGVWSIFLLNTATNKVENLGKIAYLLERQKEKILGEIKKAEYIEDTMKGFGIDKIYHLMFYVGNHFYYVTKTWMNKKIHK